jgi:hypothetical protein
MAGLLVIGEFGGIGVRENCGYRAVEVFVSTQVFERLTAYPPSRRSHPAFRLHDFVSSPAGTVFSGQMAIRAGEEYALYD